jgi:hypothetical protein
MYIVIFMLVLRVFVYLMLSVLQPLPRALDLLTFRQLMYGINAEHDDVLDFLFKVSRGIVARLSM